MKYERITERRETPLVMSMWAGDSESLKIYNRLVELENKIEAGTLVEVPKGAVVLTPEERKEKKRLADEERKRAVRWFAASVKLAFYYEFDELIPSIMADKIDALVKEVCGDDSSRAGKTEEVAS